MRGKPKADRMAMYARMGCTSNDATGGPETKAPSSSSASSSAAARQDRQTTRPVRGSEDTRYEAIPDFVKKQAMAACKKMEALAQVSSWLFFKTCVETELRSYLDVQRAFGD